MDNTFIGESISGIDLAKDTDFQRHVAIVSSRGYDLSITRYAAQLSFSVLDKMCIAALPVSIGDGRVIYGGGARSTIVVNQI